MTVIQNDCSWLLKSPSTDSYDIIEMAETTDWHLWDGSVKDGVKVSIECNDCDEGSKESCNYHGECGLDQSGRCSCYDGFFGAHCEFSEPCDEIKCECSIDFKPYLIRPL